MFAMHGSLRLQSASLHASFVGRQGLRGHVLRRENLNFDTRFAAPVLGPVEDALNLFLFVRGSSQIYSRESAGSVTVAPVVYLLRDDEIDRVSDTTKLFLRSWGPVCEVIQLRMPTRTFAKAGGLAHGAYDVPSNLLVAAKQLIAAIGRDSVVTEFISFVAALGAAGFVSSDASAGSDAKPDLASRMLSVLAKQYQSLNTSTSLKEIANQLGISLRHVGRTMEAVASAAGLPTAGFREDMRVLRLRVALLLLSAPEVSINEVAAQVGYSGAIAMSRAFRDAGLPTPSEVRMEVAALGRPGRYVVDHSRWFSDAA